MITIGNYIKHKLSGVTEIIDPIFAYNTTDKAYIIYERKNVKPDYTNDGLNHNDTEVEIRVCTSNYSEGLTIAETVRNRLELQQEIYGGYRITDSRFDGISEESDGNIFIQILSFSFITEKI